MIEITEGKNEKRYMSGLRRQKYCLVLMQRKKI